MDRPTGSKERTGFRRAFLVIALLALGLAGASGQRLSGHVPLFDGRTFAGWEGNTATTWRIERRALAGDSLGAPLPYHEYLCTTRTFANFDLRVKVKLVGDSAANGGVTFRARRLADPPNEVSGYQADMGETYWGGLYDQSRRNRFLAQPDAAEVAKILKPNDWNQYRIRCEGPRIRLWLNDVQTVDYTETDESIARSGTIGLQIHGGTRAVAAYKKITIRVLP
jgi:hypothetical protein